MNKHRIPCVNCKGSGKTKFYNVLGGVCFRCNGQGTEVVSEISYNDYKSKEATYITMCKGRVTDVKTSFETVLPKLPTAYIDNPMSITIGDNTVLYNYEYCNELKDNKIYSASFKHISDENTTDIITRLIKCHYKNEIKFFESRGNQDIVQDLKEELNDLQSLVNVQLKKLKNNK